MAVETLLFRVLSEVSSIPIEQSVDLLEAVQRFEGQPVFPKLLDIALRSAIRAYIGGRIEETEPLQSFMELNASRVWFDRVPNNDLAPLIYQISHQDTRTAARGWQWLAIAPSSVYRRREPSLLLDLCDTLLACIRISMPSSVPRYMVQILQRSRMEDEGAGVHQEIAGKLLRFAFDNVRYPLSSVVAEGFADLYVLLVQTSRRPSLLLNFFSPYEWDKGKELRATLVDTFSACDWPPGDLALAADRANIFPKVFKRLHRRSSGDRYLAGMLRDLESRSDSEALRMSAQLTKMMSNPDFYEEWD